MFSYKSFIRGLSTVNKQNFPEFALHLFHYQARNNPVYRSFIEHLGRLPKEITTISEIPFMPISFFKRHRIMTESWHPVTYFSSSGTTGSAVSKHYVPDKHVYLNNCRRIFERFYGPLDSYHLFSLLPSYAERQGSSLIAMVDHFVSLAKSPYGGSFLYDHELLVRRIAAARQQGDRQILLIGVSFALLELGEKYSPELTGTIVMETGGMKGRRVELTRDELHQHLTSFFQVEKIHSEYGMTELYSQAYSSGDGVFSIPPVMRIIFRDPYDPFDTRERSSGAINIIDLANVHSCAFIATDDLGRRGKKGLEILGRMDNSDIRGCNLLID